MTRFPPSINKARDAGAPESNANALRGRDKEQDKKRSVRLAQIETAILGLPARPGREFPIPPRDLARAFEDDYRSASKAAEAPTAKAVTEDLMALAKEADKLAVRMSKMKKEAFAALVKANGNNKIALLDLTLRLPDLASVAEFACFQRRASSGGRPGNRVATDLTRLAAFVYEGRTGKKPDLGTKRGSFHEFLGIVFKAYGVSANVRHRLDALQKTPSKKL